LIISLSATAMQQLDIFADSRDVTLRNDVLERLQLCDAVLARAALAQLASEYPDDGALADLRVLIRMLECTSSEPFADHDALAAAHRTLEAEVTPAVRRVLPGRAIQPWLAACWRSLAQRAEALAFCAADADRHAAPLWLRAGDWSAARQSVERIESWWRIPAPLAWMAEARYRSDGLDAAWPLLAELAWMAPARFDALLAILADASLDALRKRFDAEFVGRGEAEDYVWFPAWLVIVKPSLASLLSKARVQRHQAASRATVLLGEILRREREGDQHELVCLRQDLSRLNTGIFDAYMETRKVQHR
jgi:hypothetical protein